MKRTVVLILSAFLLLSGSSVFASPAEPAAERIDENTALEVSKQYLEEVVVKHFEPTWKGAQVGKPTLFYSNDGQPAVYEIQVINADEQLGYFIVGATTDISPIVKVGVGLSPTGKLGVISQELDTTQNKKVKKAKYLYGGPFALGVDIETTDGNRQKYDLGSMNKIDDIPSLSIDKTNKQKAHDQWAKEKLKLTSRAVGKAIISPMVVNTDTIVGVRSYDQSLSQSNTTGCGPAAGANVLNYYDEHGFDNLQTNTDRTTGVVLMNHMFSDMSTGSTGTSAESWASGIKKHTNTEKGYHFSTTVNYYDLGMDSYFWGQIKSQINSDHPFGFFYPLGGTPYSWHIVTVVGFYEDINSSYKTVTVRTWGSTEYVNWSGGQPSQIMWVIPSV
ncbi:hypothetical protein EHS13_25060 [Paenibacillus psychroresistens]|uniref:Peptidase C39-like domain-containing protein n=1 Tax=Paenibacillus psychroresistens TaxID=1778678 RepID=A0A6B8RQ44_9BACL|nr:C39 family peptidase [Paenibacillus psychroresistens]QGQ97924.1 hypothetical protein EHS13_25060 [Paenibacillus psychroresistens]